MPKLAKSQRLMFPLSIMGLFAISANFACLEDVCAADPPEVTDAGAKVDAAATATAARRFGSFIQSPGFKTMADLQKHRIETLAESLSRSGTVLTAAQSLRLARDGQLPGVVNLDRPVKHPNGLVEVPYGWLRTIPEGHPWAKPLTPADESFYSFFQERIVKVDLFNPANAEHMKGAAAYLKKSQSATPEFVGWTYAERTECRKRVKDAAGTYAPDAILPEL